MATNTSRYEATHDRIVEVASRALRRSGYAGVGVADVMKQAGLTHGGFYAHFSSRDALLAEAVARAGADSAAVMNARIAARRAEGASEFRAILEHYLSDSHLAGTENGCAVAALASEMPRQSEAVAAASGARVRALLARIERALPTASPAQAFQIVATMVGSLQLARAMGGAEQGRALLAATRADLLARFDLPDGRAAATSAAIAGSTAELAAARKRPSKRTSMAAPSPAAKAVSKTATKPSSKPAGKRAVR